MGQVDLGGIELFDATDRRHGELEIELGRGGGGPHDADIGETDAEGVAHEGHSRRDVEVRVVVARVTGCIHGLKGRGPQCDLVAVRQRDDSLLGNRIDSTPHPLHGVAVDARRARPQLRRVDEMADAHLVNRDARLGEMPGQSSRRPGVVEVDMSHDDPVEGFDGGISEARKNMLHRRLRARLDQCRLLVGNEEGSGDTGQAVHLGVDDLNGRVHRVLSRKSRA